MRTFILLCVVALLFIQGKINNKYIFKFIVFKTIQITEQNLNKKRK